MDFHELAKSRRSIRKYRAQPVEAEKLLRVLEAARAAPSAGNRQPWHFVVIRDQATRKLLKQTYDRDWFYGAPVIICACGGPSISPARTDARDFRDIDVAIAMDHLVLAAAAEGLGTCWIGAFDPEPLRRIIGIPDGIEPIVLTPLGYPDESPLGRERRKIDEIVHWDGWGGQPASGSDAG